MNATVWPIACMKDFVLPVQKLLQNEAAQII